MQSKTLFLHFFLWKISFSSSRTRKIVAMNYANVYMINKSLKKQHRLSYVKLLLRTKVWFRCHFCLNTYRIIHLSGMFINLHSHKRNMQSDQMQMAKLYLVHFACCCITDKVPCITDTLDWYTFFYITKDVGGAYFSFLFFPPNDRSRFRLVFLLNCMKWQPHLVRICLSKPRLFEETHWFCSSGPGWNFWPKPGNGKSMPE